MGLFATCSFTISEFLLFLFSGLNCEIDVSICNATTLFGNRPKPHCSNGGQCIDGLGAEFFCECPTGKKHILMDTLYDFLLLYRFKDVHVSIPNSTIVLLLLQ